MTKTNTHHRLAKDEPMGRFWSDIETLKSSFAQLRSHVTTFLHETFGVGKSGAELIERRASTAVADAKHRMEDLRDCGLESIRELAQKISDRPFLSAAVALGVGFVLVKLLTTKR